MRIDELREWINNLPEKFDSYQVVIMNNASPIENSPGNALVKFISIDTVMIDAPANKGVFANHVIMEKYDKIIGGNNEEKSC